MIPLFNWFKRNNKLTALCASIWAAIILGACLLPGKDVPSFSIFQHDKLIHFGIFGLLAFLILLSSKKLVTYKVGLFIFLLCAAYGYLVEILQGSGITKGRSFDLYDALADSLGALLGVLIYFGAQYLSNKRLKHKSKS